MSVSFSHDELEIKRRFLELAREYLDKSSQETDDGTDLAFELAAALLYMNVADYLAEYLTQGISALSRSSVSRYYFSVIKVRPSSRKHYNIEESIKELKKYDFPSREEVLKKLGEVKTARNKVAHEILKTKAEDLLEIDTAVRKLRDSTEALIDLVDEIQLGMPPKNMSELLAAPGPNTSEENDSDDSETSE